MIQIFPVFTQHSGLSQDSGFNLYSYRAFPFFQEYYVTPGLLFQLAERSSTPQHQLLHDLDDFMGHLSAEDARMLVDLLKLAIAERTGDGEKSKMAVSSVLASLTKSYPQVRDYVANAKVVSVTSVLIISSECAVGFNMPLACFSDGL